MAYVLIAPLLAVPLTRLYESRLGLRQGTVSWCRKVISFAERLQFCVTVTTFVKKCAGGLFFAWTRSAPARLNERRLGLKQGTILLHYPCSTILAVLKGVRSQYVQSTCNTPACRYKYALHGLQGHGSSYHVVTLRQMRAKSRIDTTAVRTCAAISALAAATSRSEKPCARTRATSVNRASNEDSVVPAARN